MNRVRRIVGAAGAIALMAGCGSSPQSIDVEETRVPDFTVTFDGLQLTLERANFGWVPAEGPIPGPDPVRMTVLLRIVNVGSGSRTLPVATLRLRTWDGTYPYDPPRNTPTWSATTGGRAPALDSVRLEVGEAVQGWLTYEVPRREARADAFVWSPEPGRAFRIDFPQSVPLRFCGATRVFGRVTTAGGAPVAGAEVDVLYWILDRPGSGFEGGRCVGEPPGTIPAVTGEDGRYSAEQLTRFCDVRCYEAAITAPAGSGLQDARSGGGTVLPGTPHPMIEPSELRLDAVLPAE